MESAEKSLSKPEDNVPPIEVAMERIETLIGEIEAGQLSLEELLARYEEGMKLVRSCQERLDAAEQKIQIITRNVSGPAGIEDFSANANES